MQFVACECYYIYISSYNNTSNLTQALPVTYVGQSGPSFTVFWTRTTFDLTFFIIVTILGLHLVIAILVDRFSELRSEWVRLLLMLI